MHLADWVPTLLGLAGVKPPDGEIFLDWLWWWSTVGGWCQSILRFGRGWPMGFNKRGEGKVSSPVCHSQHWSGRWERNMAGLCEVIICSLCCYNKLSFWRPPFLKTNTNLSGVRNIFSKNHRSNKVGRSNCTTCSKTHQKRQILLRNFLIWFPVWRRKY